MTVTFYYTHFRLLACLLATSMPFILGLNSASAEGDNSVTAAMRTLFNPRRSPPQRTMGLSQRSFLDLVEQSKPKLQIALVIDGTESMEPALSGVREALEQMMNDLELYQQSDIAYQLVIYRDVAAPSGEATIPLKLENNAFTKNRNAVLTAVQSLATESGAPYFPELVDYGVHQALTQLDWSEDDDVSRWIFLFGDAPPFDSTLNEPKTGASRRFATEALVALAEKAKVQINCVLCSTRNEDREAYDAVLPQTRAFMNALSSGSGGLMLDLSYDDIRTAILQADSTSEITYSPVGTITREEVEQTRTSLAESRAGSEKPITLAILPHAPLEEMTFASNAFPAQLAAELRMRMRSVPGVTVAEALVVERRFDQLRRNSNYSGLRDEALLQTLSRSLRSDYVLWGDVKNNRGQRRVVTRLYDAATGEVVAQAEGASTETVKPDQLGSLLAGNLMMANFPSPTHRPLASRFAYVVNNAGQQAIVTRLIASSNAHDDLVAGMAALEKALAYQVGQQEGQQLLVEAERHLDRAAKTDDANALPHFLLAHCLFNRAKQQQNEGEPATTLMKRFGRELRDAYRFRTTLVDRRLRQEIEADYALLVRGRPNEAIPLYQKLAAGLADEEAARRAQWMLAGIYGGDWGVDEEFVDRDSARESLIQILSRWPESNEARFIRRVLRWDEQKGSTRFPQFPLENQELATQIDRAT